MPDCLDKSDERDCELLWLEAGYNKYEISYIRLIAVSHAIEVQKPNQAYVGELKY